MSRSPYDFMISSGVASQFDDTIPQLRAVPLSELYDDPPIKQTGHERHKKFDATELTKHWAPK